MIAKENQESMSISNRDFCGGFEKAQVRYIRRVSNESSK